MMAQVSEELRRYILGDELPEDNEDETLIVTEYELEQMANNTQLMNALKVIKNLERDISLATIRPTWAKEAAETFNIIFEIVSQFGIQDPTVSPI